MILPVDEWVPVGTPEWWVLAGIAAFGRGSDLLSTYLATPGLILEGNPIARRLGWRWGVALNALVVVLAAGWPVLVVSLATTSILVAARNLQSAWLMRSMGEWNYRQWMSERLDQGHRPLAWACHLGEAALFGMLGLALLWFSRWQLVPFGIGLGLASYSVAVAGFTSLSLWRSRP
ncbi:MAG: hypothetical protein U1G08_18225 [Verrucomicrobiota bacterium]